MSHVFVRDAPNYSVCAAAIQVRTLPILLSGITLGKFVANDISSSSYVVDPIWQRRFSAIWATFAAVAILVSLPHFLRSLKHGRSLRGLFGVSESIAAQRYAAIGDAEVKPRTRRRTVSGIIETASSLFWWSLPGIGLTLGQSL